MVFAVVFIALCLAVHRVTRLLTKDEIPLIKIPRDRMVNWLDPMYGPGDPQEGQPAPHSKAALWFTPAAVGLLFLTAGIILIAGYRPVALLVAELILGGLLGLTATAQAQAARSVAYLLECPVCTSVYVAAAFSWAGASWLHLEGLAGRPLTWVVAGLAASSVTVLIAAHEERLEQYHKLAQFDIDKRAEDRKTPPARTVH